MSEAESHYAGTPIAADVPPNQGDYYTRTNYYVTGGIALHV